MAFFIWFKQNKLVFMLAHLLLSAIILISTVLPGMGATTGKQQMAKQYQVSRKLDKPITFRGNSLSRNDIYLMARVIEGEAADEPYAGKVAVGAVIVNRIESPFFPDSLEGVVFQPDAFEAATNDQYNRPVSKESLKAAQEAIRGRDPTGESLYYWNPEKATSTWVWSRPVVLRIGNHVFAK